MSYTMGINCEVGTKVKFVGKNGTQKDLTEAWKHFTLEQVVTVKDISIGKFHSFVEFEELPGKHFNTVMFEEIDSITRRQKVLDVFVGDDYNNGEFRVGKGYGGGYWHKAKLIIELPERKVTISESEFDEIMKSTPTDHAGRTVVIDQLREKIFSKAQE